MLLLACSGQLYAQSYILTMDSAGREEGSYLWRHAVGGIVLGQPVVQGRSVAMVLDGGSLRAHCLSGRRLWSFSARGRLSPYLTRSSMGVSYIGRTNGTLIAVNGSGREIWRSNLGEELSAPVVLGWDGRVFAPTSRSISCFTAAGTLLWRRDFSYRISAGPWQDQNGGILLALESGDALRVGPFGDVTTWRLPSAPVVMVSVMRPATRNPSTESSSASATARPAILSLHRGGDVWLLDPAQPCAPPVSLPRLASAPVAAVGRGERAAALLASGEVLMLSHEGEVLWSADSHIRGSEASEVSLTYDGRGVYVLSQATATAFSCDGERLWLAALRNVSGIPAFGDNGVLFSGSANWIFYAWELEDANSVLSRARNGAAPEASYGMGNPPPSSLAGSPMRFNDGVVRAELDAIQRGILAGSVGENEPEWIAFLKETAEAGIRPGSSAISAQPRVAVTHRVRALHLLGRIGSSESVPWLAQFFGREHNPTVRAAAAAAIGGIGFDPCGRAIGEFAAVARPGSQTRDELVLLSVAAATGSLCRISGPAAYDGGVRVLTLLGSPSQPASVQRQARRELESLLPYL